MFLIPNFFKKNLLLEKTDQSQSLIFLCIKTFNSYCQIPLLSNDVAFVLILFNYILQQLLLWWFKTAEECLFQYLKCNINQFWRFKPTEMASDGYLLQA